MAKKTQIREIPQLVEKVYDYKGIKVGVRIDFRQKHITLTESNGTGVKKWIFSNREVKYMAGWKAVFKAMEYATTQAEKELREHLEAEENERLKAIAAMGDKKEKK